MDALSQKPLITKEQEWEIAEEDYYPIIPQEYRRWSTLG